jgi:Membrane-fusion protein
VERLPSVRSKIRALVDQPTGLADIEIDHLATSQQLQSWETVQIPDRLRFSARLAVTLLLLFAFVIAFVPWTQTITATGLLSAYSPYERPQDIESQITGRLKKWHVYEGVRVKQGELILEMDDVDPNFMAPELLTLLEKQKAALEQNRTAALERADQLTERIKAMQSIVKAAGPSAEARVRESDNKVRAADNESCRLESPPTRRNSM